MEIAGIVHSIIRNEKPDQVAVDVGGLGAGVVDRLIELGHDSVVAPINFGSASSRSAAVCKPTSGNVVESARLARWRCASNDS